MSGYIKGLVETGIKKVIEDEVSARLKEMFPDRNGTIDRWGQEVRSISIDILKNDPEIKAFIKGAILDHLRTGLVKSIKGEVG